MTALGIFPRVFLLGLMFAAMPVNAQTAGQNTGQNTGHNSSILTVNQDRLFMTSLFGERIRGEIEAERSTLEISVRQIEADLVAEEKSLTEQRPTMPPDEFRALADAFDEKVQGIRQAHTVKVQHLGQRLDQERGRYFKLVLPILGEIMNERGAVVVLDQRTVFASANRVDITDDAVARIDATIGDGTNHQVLPPAPDQ